MVIARVYKGGERVSNGAYTNGAHRWESNVTFTCAIIRKSPYTYLLRMSVRARAINSLRGCFGSRLHWNLAGITACAAALMNVAGIMEEFSLEALFRRGLVPRRVSTIISLAIY